LDALKLVSKAGLLPTGIIHFWARGVLTEILLRNVEIDDTDVHRNGKKVDTLLHSAVEALRLNDGKKAEELLKQGLLVEPGRVDLLNNLAMAYQFQGRNREANALVKDIYTRYPDYVLGRISMAMINIQEGNLECAEELLEPLRWKKQMSHSEFDAFCAAQIELAFAKELNDQAKSWFEIWKSADPENSKLDRYRFRFDRLTPGSRNRKSRKDILSSS
jgi:tetratricopeptide (TPR) repeat protein